MQQTLFQQPESIPSPGQFPDVIRVPLSGPDRPAWMPADMARRLAARVANGYSDGFRFSFTRAERKILRKRKRLPVSVWAERHRVLTMSSMPGPWRNEVTPYLTGIMDAIAFPSVRVVSVCKCPQSGGTEAVHNFVGSVIDQDPGPVMYVYPDQATAEDNSKDRILPMIQSSPRLKGFLSGKRNDEAVLRINMVHMPIYLGWSSSVSRLGNKPIKYAIADEVDKYMLRSSRETGPLELIDKRLNTYRDNSKFIKISTPTVESGPIWQALKTDAQVVFYYWVRCPECGRDQLMTFKGIKFGACRDPKVMLHENLARYQCAHCPALWDDHERNKAVALGEWRAQGEGDPFGLSLPAYLETFRPHNIAFHLPAWVVRFVSLSESAAAFLETLDTDSPNVADKRRNFANQYEALPYKQIVVTPTAQKYTHAILDLPAQFVPQEAIALTCGIDVQKFGFYFLIRAWARDYTSWLVHYGLLPAWEDVETMLFDAQYPVMDSERRMRICRAAIDTGGGERDYGDMTMTEETYFWIRKNGVGRGARVWGTKGASWAQANKIKMSKPIDKTPAGKPLPGGLSILTLDTEKLKDAFFWRLDQAVKKGEMAAYLNKSAGQEYFSHITAEQKEMDDKNVMRWVQKRKRNDWLDCECLAAACADPEWPDGGIHLMAPPRAEAKVSARKDEAVDREARDRRGYERPGWMNR